MGRNERVHTRFFMVRCVSFFLLCSVFACGSRPPVRVSAGIPSWVSGFGGAFVGGCLAKETLWIWSTHHVYRFQARANMPPRMVSTHAIKTDGGKSVLSQSVCHLSGFRVRFSDGRTQLIGMKPAENDQWHDGYSLASTGAQGFALEQGQSLNVSRKGWVFQQDGRRVDWRRVSAEIRDAVLKGGEIWMLSDDGLWRVSLKNRQITSVALPAIFGNSPFTALFQDGSTLWIRTEANQAWPLTIQGNYAMPAGRGGPVAAPPLRTQLPIADGFLDWEGPGTPL